MEIDFKTSKMKKTFESQRLLLKEYGQDQAKKIQLRMAVLEGASNLSEVPTIPPDRCHELEGTLSGYFAVDLKHPFRLIFKPDYETVQLKDDGGIDLVKITKIKIIEVGDYH